MEEKMKIDREKVKRVFQEYTNTYDSTDEKIKLKIGHTYRVAALCERIVAAEQMDAEDMDLAWLLGMLHDVGRFEQLRRYNTFSDADSIDHAKLGADILFGTDAAGQKMEEKDGYGQDGSGERKRILDYIDCRKEDALIETAIRQHSAFRLTEGLDERTVKFCHILRDADKVDILRVNVEVPLEEIYNTTTQELRNAMVTEEVLQSFYEHHAVLRSLKKTPVDHVVGHISLVYELVYPESRRAMKEQGYLDQLLNFETENPKTREQFVLIREEMKRFLAENG